MEGGGEYRVSNIPLEGRKSRGELESFFTIAVAGGMCVMSSAGISEEFEQRSDGVGTSDCI